MKKKHFLYLACGILSAAVTAGGILLSLRNKDLEKPAHQVTKVSKQKSLVEKVLEYESKAELIEEAVTPNLTAQDEDTLEAIRTFSEDYYEAVDKLIEGKRKITSKDYSPIFYRLVGKPLGDHILANNKELRKKIIAYNNGRFSTIEEYCSFLENYFFERGVYVAMESKFGSFGSVSSLVAYRINKKGKISADIFGHKLEGISTIGLGEEINPGYIRSRLRKRIHVGKAHTLVHGYSNVDNIFRSFEERASKVDVRDKKSFDEVEKIGVNASELIDRLLFIGLYGRGGNEKITEDKKRAYLRSVRLHEATHGLFHRLYPNKNMTSLAYSNKNEQSSYLTELVTARDCIVYLRLANYLAMGNDIEHKEGAGQFVNFCVNYIYEHQQSFQNINFNGNLRREELAQDIFLQFDKLSVPQIRSLAARYLITNLPKHVEKLK